MTSPRSSPREREAQARDHLLRKELRRRLRLLGTLERRLHREEEYLLELEALKGRLVAAHALQIATVEKANASRFSATAEGRMKLSRLAASEALPTWEKLRRVQLSLKAARRRQHREATTTGKARQRAVKAALLAFPVLR